MMHVPRVELEIKSVVWTQMWTQMWAGRFFLCAPAVEGIGNSNARELWWLHTPAPAGAPAAGSLQWLRNLLTENHNAAVIPKALNVYRSDCINAQ